MIFCHVGFHRCEDDLLSIAEPGRWDDPTQKLLLTMVAAFAEFEKSLIASRLSSGRKTKARNGGYAGGKALLVTGL